MKSLAKEIIALDRIARKKIELLEIEKKNINSFLAQKRVEYANEYTKKVETEIKVAKNEAIAAVTSALRESSKNYNERLTKLESVYNANKEKWILELFEECTK